MLSICKLGGTINRSGFKGGKSADYFLRTCNLASLLHLIHLKLKLLAGSLPSQ